MITLGAYTSNCWYKILRDLHLIELLPILIKKKLHRGYNSKLTPELRPRGEKSWVEKISG